MPVTAVKRPQFHFAHHLGMATLPNNPKRILIAYASRGGSTVGVAEAIAETLRAAGFDVDCRHLKTIGSMGGFDAYVIGSPIWAGRWLPEAAKFVAEHGDAIRTKPHALFVTCMRAAEDKLPLSDKEKAQIARQQSRGVQQETAHEAITKWIAPIAAQLRPVAVGEFAGAMDPATVPFLMRLVLKLMGKTQKVDARDWPAIRAWAASLPGQFGLVETVKTAPVEEVPARPLQPAKVPVAA